MKTIAMVDERRPRARQKVSSSIVVMKKKVYDTRSRERIVKQNDAQRSSNLDEQSSSLVLRKVLLNRIVGHATRGMNGDDVDSERESDARNNKKKVFIKYNLNLSALYKLSINEHEKILATGTMRT